MNVVYNSEHYSVLAYPVAHGFELVDKAGRRSLFLQGALAKHFTDRIEQIPDEERTEEAIDQLVSDFCVGSAQPIVFH